MPFLRRSAFKRHETQTEHIGLADFSLLILRVSVALPMFFYQAMAHSLSAWDFLWSQKNWPLLEAMKTMGIPQPPVSAVALTFVLLTAAFGIFIGFLTRINAALTLAAMGFFFLSGLPLSDWLSGQTYVLYFGMCLALILSGPGNFSLDGVFAFLRHRRQIRLSGES